jgi:hypothetical protein
LTVKFVKLKSKMTIQAPGVIAAVVVVAVLSGSIVMVP